MPYTAEFSSEVDGFITTGDISEEGFEVRVTGMGTHPLYTPPDIMRFVIYESDSEEGYCDETTWIVPVPDLSAVHGFTVQEHKENGARLLVLSVYNEGDPFENPEIAIEIDRVAING